MIEFNVINFIGSVLILLLILPYRKMGMRELKIFLIFVATLFSIGVIYLIHRLCQKTEIIDIHKNVILVRNFPLTNYGKMKWWKEHAGYLREKYNFPITESDGSFSLISIIDIGGGYKADSGTDQDSDLLCFEDMKVKENCIEKNTVMRIYQNADRSLDFQFSSSWF